MYVRAYMCAKLDRFSLRKRSFTSSPYIRIYLISQLRYNHVIIMSYLKCSCVLMGYYVFAIKLRYYERRKVRHYASPLHYYYDYYIYSSIIIQLVKKSPFIIKYVVIKKRIRIDFLHRASYI